MADKTYKLEFGLSDGTTQEVRFTVPQGEAGKSAYEYAKEAGYTGTEEEFAEKIAAASAVKVGDTLTTARTDLDETWLLCNGDQVSAQDYGELAKLFPSLPTNWGGDGLWSSATGISINCIAYANGYWVVGGGYYDGSAYKARIAYTTDPTGTWTTKDLWTGGGANYTINCVTYANGYWVVGGTCVDSIYYARIAYTTDITGEWTTKDLWSGTFSTVRCITYTNGYWVLGGILGGSSTYYARIAYTADLTGTWTTKDLWSGAVAGNTCINCMTYANGYWVVGGGYYDGSKRYARIAYATDLTGSWTTNNLWYATTSIINCITHANGYWVVGGVYYNNYKYNARIAYATDPTGAWTTKDLWSNDSHENNVTGIANCGSYWVVCARYYYDGCFDTRVAYTTDITGEWTIEDLWNGESAVVCANCIAYANRYWVVGGTYVSGSVDYARIAYSDSGVFVLPTISGKDTYTYIKAKEE